MFPVIYRKNFDFFLIPLKFREINFFIQSQLFFRVGNVYEELEKIKEENQKLKITLENNSIDPKRSTPKEIDQLESSLSQHEAKIHLLEGEILPLENKNKQLISVNSTLNANMAENETKISRLLEHREETVETNDYLKTRVDSGPTELRKDTEVERMNLLIQTNNDLAGKVEDLTKKNKQLEDVANNLINDCENSAVIDQLKSKIIILETRLEVLAKNAKDPFAELGDKSILLSHQLHKVRSGEQSLLETEAGPSTVSKTKVENEGEDAAAKDDDIVEIPISWNELMLTNKELKAELCQRKIWQRSLEEINKRVEKKNVELEAEMLQLNSKLRIQENSQEQIKKSGIDGEATVGNISNQLKHEQAMYLKLSTKHRNLLNDMNKITSENANLLDNIEKIRTANSDLEAKIRDKEIIILELDTEVEQLKRIINKSKMEELNKMSNKELDEGNEEGARRKISELEAEIVQLKENIRNQESLIHETNKRTEELEELRKEKNLVVELRAKIKIQESEIEEIRRAKDQNKGNEEQARKNISELETEVAQLRAKIQIQEFKMVEMNKRSKALEEESKELARLKASNLENEVMKLKEKIKNQDLEIEEVNNRAKELDEENEELATKTGVMEFENDKLATRIKELQQKLNTEENTCSKLRQSATKLQEELNENNKQRIKEVSADRDLLHRLEEMCTQLRQNTTTLQEEINEKNKQLAEMSANRDRLHQSEENCTQLRQNTIKLQDELNDKNKHIEKASADKDRLEKDQQRLETEKSLLQSRLDAAESRLKKEKKSRENIKEQIDEIERQFEHEKKVLSIEVAQLKLNIETKDQTVKKEIVRSSRLKEQLSRNDSALQDAEKRISEKDILIKKLEEKIESVNTRLANLESVKLAKPETQAKEVQTPHCFETVSEASARQLGDGGETIEAKETRGTEQEEGSKETREGVMKRKLDEDLEEENKKLRKEVKRLR